VLEFQPAANLGAGVLALPAATAEPATEAASAQSFATQSASQSQPAVAATKPATAFAAPETATALATAKAAVTAVAASALATHAVSGWQLRHADVGDDIAVLDGVWHRRAGVYTVQLAAVAGVCEARHQYQWLVSAADARWFVYRLDGEHICGV